MAVMASRQISITIAVPLAEAYAFAHKPENFPQWAAGLSQSLHQTDRGWVAQTPAGEAIVRFSPANDFGVLDHWVTLPDGQEISIPLRMIDNGGATELVFTLFRQPSMDDAAFEADAEAVHKDLQALKALLESGAA